MANDAWEHRAAAAGMAMPKQCPVTSGLPSTMTMESFQRACDKYRALNRGDGWHGKGTQPLVRDLPRAAQGGEDYHQEKDDGDPFR